MRMGIVAVTRRFLFCVYSDSLSSLEVIFTIFRRISYYLGMIRVSYTYHTYASNLLAAHTGELKSVDSYCQLIICWQYTGIFYRASEQLSTVYSSYYCLHRASGSKRTIP